MKLKCRINEKDYDVNLVAGATFSEEYNETLDSGSIIIDQIPKIENLKPYDDVYIWNADEEFVGYYNVGDEIPLSGLGGTVDCVVSPTPGTTDDWVDKESDISINANNIQGKYDISGKIIGIWGLGLFRNLGKDRFSLGKITFKFRITDTQNPGQKLGYYSLPETADDIRKDGTYLVVRKDNGYASDEGTPDFLLVGFSFAYYKSITSGFTASPKLLLGNQATKTEGGGAVYNIDSIEILDSGTIGKKHLYPYRENITATNTARITISNLETQEILGMRNLRICCFADSYYVELVSGNPVMIGGGTIRIPFFKRNAFLTITDSIAMDFVKQGNSWVSTTELIMVQKNLLPPATKNFAINGIVEPLGPNAYVVISSSPRSALPRFFLHMLVDGFKCDMVDFDDNDPGSNIKAANYKYKIDLMSETKRLEKVILPNISITQPIVGDKRSIWYYLNQFVDLYSPKIKVISENNEWEYKNKYKIDQRSVYGGSFDDEYIGHPVHEIFDDNVFAPEMSLTAPTLRELLSRLMVVKDCIPVVKNDVIYAMKISEAHGRFKANSKNFSFITESMNSSNYSTAFRREYGGAISQKNSTHMVEFLGFRNSGDALMTLDNMYLETRFPIYKINKLYMCYYKSVGIENHSGGSVESYKKLILVKQDITKLVLQNVVRDALPADWTNLPSGSWNGIGVDEMAKHRVLTLGFDIGSNKITGWGEKYSYLGDILGWTKQTYTYLETIIGLIDGSNPWGVNGLQFLERGEEVKQSTSEPHTRWQQQIVSPSDTSSADSNITNKLKTIFFQMDYIGMYSGAIVHSKENTEEDNIQTSDNCSSALSILEVDGLFEKEKANRLGNSEVSFIARYDSVDEMKNEENNNILGAVYGDDVVIYHKEYQIYEDCVLANFVGTKDYVMKNYFTTVFAKYRTYSYASYDQNVNRAETDKYTVVVSDDRCFYEKNEFGSNLLGAENILSGFSESVFGDDLNIYFPKQINGGYFSFSDGKEFFSDVNQFVSGYSLCFNIKTFGSITNGNFISAINCYDQKNEQGRKYVGSVQDWYVMPIAENDGFLEKMGCYFGHFEESELLPTNIRWNETPDETNRIYDKILKLPLKQTQPTFSFGKSYKFCKDEKEIIDFTLQYELVNQDDNVLMSEWLMKLTDFNNYLKFSTDVEVIDRSVQQDAIRVLFGSAFVNWNAALLFFGNSGNTYERQILIQVDENRADLLRSGTELVDCFTRVPYWSRFFIAGNPGSVTGGDGTASGEEDVKIYIMLTSIAEVVKDGNNNITQLKARAYYSAQSFTSGPYIASSASSESTIVLTFEKRESQTPGYLEFYYHGQDAPGQPWEVSVSINNGRSLGSNPDVSYGGVYADAQTIGKDKTMYVLTSASEMEKSLVYAQYKLSELAGKGFSIVNTSPKINDDGQTFEDIFSIDEDQYGRPYIHYKENPILGSDYQSVQYWYYDANGDGYLHFVFGLNTKPGDGDKKSYVSILKNRDTKVYNALHRVAAKVANCATDVNASKYGAQRCEEEEG